jgi:hypothetical protein
MVGHKGGNAVNQPSWHCAMRRTCQLLLFDVKGVRLRFLVFKQPIEQRLELCGRHVVRQVQLGPCIRRQHGGVSQGARSKPGCGVSPMCSPVSSPSADWNCTMTLETCAGSIRGCLAGGSVMAVRGEGSMRWCKLATT